MKFEINQLWNLRDGHVVQIKTILDDFLVGIVKTLDQKEKIWGFDGRYDQSKVETPLDIISQVDLSNISIQG